jgi:hypothetical protein
MPGEFGHAADGADVVHGNLRVTRLQPRLGGGRCRTVEVLLRAARWGAVKALPAAPLNAKEAISYDSDWSAALPAVRRREQALGGFRRGSPLRTHSQGSRIGACLGTSVSRRNRTKVLVEPVLDDLSDPRALTYCR